MRLVRQFVALTVAVSALLLAEAHPHGSNEAENCEEQEYHTSIRVLMDSWSHRSLLSHDKHSLWMENGETCEDSNVSSCSSASLETQEIHKSLPTDDTYPVRIFVNITFSTNCSTSECATQLSVKNTSSSTSTTVILPDTDLLIEDPGSDHKQFYFDVNQNEFDSFRLTLQSPDSDGCTTVSRVLVYRHECPGPERLDTGLSVLPSTQAPVNGSVPATPFCVENASPAVGSRLNELKCNSEGVWINDQTNCQCNVGFFRVENVCKDQISPDKSVYEVSEIQNSVVVVCFTSEEAINEDFQIATDDHNSATRNFDYVPVERNVEFHQGGLNQCIAIPIISDELAESMESFSVNVYSGSQIVSMANVTILDNDGSDLSCTEGRVAVVSDANNSSLQLVEMCQSQRVWSPLCDSDWTQQDVAVVCRELGYTNSTNYTTLKGSNSIQSNIQCNGDEVKIADCPTAQTATPPFCHYLLVKCTNTLPTAPMPTTPTDRVLSTTHTEAVTSTLPAVSSRPGPTVTEAVTSPLPAVPSRPGPTVTETNSQRRAFPLATIAAVSVVTIIIAVAVTALIFGLVFVLLSRKRSRHDTDTSKGGHLSNPMYETTIQKDDNVVEMKRDGHKQEEPEESATLYNPLYTKRNGANSGHNGNGVSHSETGCHEEEPEYSVPKLPFSGEYETPVVTSPSVSQGPTPPPPQPHDYDYASVAPPYVDPEYAPLENVGTHPTHISPTADRVGGTVTYHTLEPPENPVTYHVLEAPISPRVSSYESENVSSEVGVEGEGDEGFDHEYATVEHD